jgi:peroxiredoxin
MKTAPATKPSIQLPQILTVGDIAPDCSMRDASGQWVHLRSDSIAGHPIVLAFCPRGSAAGKEVLQKLAEHFEAFKTNSALVFAISASPISEPTLPFQIFPDPEERVFAGFSAPRDRVSIVVLRRNQHVAGILAGDAATQVATALSLIEGMGWESQPISMPVHPPVLLIPEALSRDDCEKLINIFETSGQTFIERPPPIGDFLNGADFKMRIPEHGRKDRIDHFFFDKGMLAFLNNRLNRVVPEIAKAFQYQVQQSETLRVARYEGHRGGHLHGHRDNNPPTPYRKFAMSINLNTKDFEGGELRFPEFGDQRYRPDSGTAIVFSSSLLHEAMHVTAGHRYVLLAFLF